MPIPKALPTGILPPFLKSPARREDMLQLELAPSDQDTGVSARLETLKKERHEQRR